jgi:imidazoleglycerol-phosphate dehydratase
MSEIHPPRSAVVRRETRETRVEVTINLDGPASPEVHTGVGFLDHMLTLMASHGLFGLRVEATGDTHVDDHHTVEDVGITLGQAMNRALGDRDGISRFGDATVPMDEALALVAVDVSGRGWLAFDAIFPAPKVGHFDTGLVEEFLRALAANAGITLHVRLLAGRNSHHIAEAIFKGTGRALASAVASDPRRSGIPSTKGTLTG